MVDARLPSRKSIAPAVMLTLLMMLMSASPLLTALAPNAEASGVARHAYGFSDGSTEYVALYQGASSLGSERRRFMARHWATTTMVTAAA